MTAPKRFPESKANLTKIMTDYFLGNHARAAGGTPVVWIAVNAPIEILNGFDLVVVAPENHSAVCAARGIGGGLAEEAEGMGFSMDLCSYARIDIGSFFGKADSGGMGLPRPSLLVSDNNNCTLLVKWFDVYRRELGVPHFVMDVPFCYGPQRVKDVDYMVSQFSDLIDRICRLTGQRFDIEKTREALALTDEANRQWKRFYDLARTRPSAITAFDTFVHMAPYVVYRGTKTLVDHFTMLADEAEQQMRDGIYPVPDEKYRLLWDNIAPWHQLRAMSTRLKDLSANIIYATYTSCIGSGEGEIDAIELTDPDPLKNVARMQNFTICSYGLDLRFQAMARMISRYGIDGVVFSSNRSCKVYSVMQMDLMRRVKEAFGIPAVMVDVDHADVRKYSQESFFLRLEALLEEIEAGRSVH